MKTTEQEREYYKKYREKNREKINSRHREHYKNNREKILEKNKKYNKKVKWWKNEKAIKARNEWRKNNPFYFVEMEWKRRGIKNYLGTFYKKQDYESMFKIQNGRCAICGNEKNEGKKIKMCVDHDHKTGKARGLLCDGCNKGIGNLKEKIENFEAAIKYLGGF